MQTELDKIVKWLSANKLSINASKTKILLFKGKNKSQNQQISLRINNDIIKQVSSVRFLGLIIDEGLTWKEHIDSVSKNIIKSSSLIAKLQHYANKNSLKLIYYAFEQLGILLSLSKIARAHLLNLIFFSSNNENMYFEIIF